MIKFGLKFQERTGSFTPKFGEVSVVTYEDGFSPTVELTETENGVDVSITDKNGVKTAFIKNGADGADGADGTDGEDGASAYELAVANGFVGTEAEWLASLKGNDGAAGETGPAGADGKSAYAYAVDGGYIGTEEEFAAKLAAEMPTALPNPSALTFSGAVSGSYDGSAPLKVEIPIGGEESSWLHEKIILEESVTVWNIPIPSAKRVILMPYLRANNAENSLTTGNIVGYFFVNGAYAGYPLIYLRNSAKFYYLYDVEKVGTYTKVLNAGPFDNGVAYSTSKNFNVLGWKQTQEDTADKITSVRFSLTGDYVFPADCVVEVWYK